MAFVVADRVKETSTSTGTTPVALAGAMTGYIAFSAIPGIAIGDTLYYSIQAIDAAGFPAAEWECGLGTYSAANTLTRTTVTASSNAGAAVAFSAGTKQVYLTMPAVQVKWMRERLTAARTYYVRTDGSDSNSGLANTSGGAFLTLQKAADVISGNLDLGGQTVTVQVADGTYTAGVVLPAYSGAGSVSFVGNTTTPANVVVSTTSASCFFASTPQTYSVSGFKVQTTTSGHGLNASGNAVLTFGNMDFGACAGVQIGITTGATVAASTNYAISGAAQCHVQVTEGGVASLSGKTITITGTPAFSVAYIYARGCASANMNGCTFSGSATGVRYSINNCSACFVNGASTTYLPGGTAGTTAVGGQYG